MGKSGVFLTHVIMLVVLEYGNASRFSWCVFVIFGAISMAVRKSRIHDRDFIRMQRFYATAMILCHNSDYRQSMCKFSSFTVAKPIQYYCSDTERRQTVRIVQPGLAFMQTVRLLGQNTDLQ